MSSSYSALNQKYNTLLSLVLDGEKQSLQDVINVNDNLNGATPTTDQVIKYNGTNVVWGSAGGNQSLQDVINVDDNLNGATPSTNQVIKYNGSNVVWSDENQTLNQVLTTGNTTTQSAIFGTSLSTSRANTIDYSSITINDEFGTNSVLNNNSLTFNFSSFPSFSSVGISNIGSGLNLKTNGTLKLQDLIGTTGQYLSLNSLGNAVWSTLSIIQRGETDVLSSTSGSVTYATPYTSKPYVVLSLNTNNSTVFIPIGVVNHTINVDDEYVGFTYGSASTSTVATITWYATL